MIKVASRILVIACRSSQIIHIYKRHIEPFGVDVELPLVVRNL